MPEADPVSSRQSADLNLVQVQTLINDCDVVILTLTGFLIHFRLSYLHCHTISIILYTYNIQYRLQFPSISLTHIRPFPVTDNLINNGRTSFLTTDTKIYKHYRQIKRYFQNNATIRLKET